MNLEIKVIYKPITKFLAKNTSVPVKKPIIEKAHINIIVSKTKLNKKLLININKYFSSLILFI